MVLHRSDSYTPFLVERALTNGTTMTNSLSSSSGNLSGVRPSDLCPSVTPSFAPPIPFTSLSSTSLSSILSPPSSSSSSTGPGSPSSISSQRTTLSTSSTSSTGSRSITSPSSTSSTGSRSSTEASSVFQVVTSSQPFPFSTEALSSGTTSGPMISQSSFYPSDVGNGYLQQTITPSLPISIGSSPPVSLMLPSLNSPSSSTRSESTIMSTESSSSMPTSSSSMSSPDGSSAGSPSPISTHTLLPSSPAPTLSSHVSHTSITSGCTSCSTVPTILLSSTSLPSSLSASTSTVSSTVTITSSSSTFSFSSSHAASTFGPSTTSISTSTILISSTKVDGSSTTSATTPWTSTLILTSVLQNSGTTTWTTTTSGVLSTVGVGNTANGLSRSPGSIAGLVLGILGAISFATLWLFCARRRHRQLIRDASAIPPWAPGGPLETEVDMEEPYAGILAALQAGMGAGRNAHIEGDTSGEVSGELAVPHSSSPTLPLYSLPGEGHNDGLHMFPLSPPPSAYVPVPPPSAYVPPASSKGPRRRGSPGPDASAWFAGHHIAPASSVTSHHSVSTSNVLTRTETGTRTRTGSEEPLLTRVGSGSSYLDSGNKIRLGSAFGSPKGSLNGHNLSPTSPSSGRRSNTISSFGALRSVSSRGALRSMSSHGYEFGFGSVSSGTGSHRGPALGLAISGAPNSYKSKRAIKWKRGKRESTGSSTSATSTSAGGSVDDKPVGVRAFLGRLRLRNTPSSKANSFRELESEGASEKRNSDAPGLHNSPRTFSAVLSPATPPPEPASVPTSPRFVLSNPDPQPHSPYVNVDAEGALQGHEDDLRPPTWPWLGHTQRNMLPPSPAPTLGSRISAAEGLLDPRLRENVEGRSNASLRDFEDYSRPIGGLVNNRMHSTTTFGTVDSQDGTSMRNQEDDQQDDDRATATQIPRASWIVDGGADDFHAR